MVRLRLTELKRAIKNILSEMEFSENIEKMVDEWNKNPNNNIDVVVNNLEMVNEKIGRYPVEFLKPTKKAFENKGIDVKKLLFIPSVAIYIELPNRNEKTLIYDLETNKYTFDSFNEFYLKWAEGKNIEE